MLLYAHRTVKRLLCSDSSVTRIGKCGWSRHSSEDAKLRVKALHKLIQRLVIIKRKASKLKLELLKL
jgi:hypothetical protein